VAASDVVLGNKEEETARSFVDYESRRVLLPPQVAQARLVQEGMGFFNPLEHCF
jgi:hypothetical protein